MIRMVLFNVGENYYPLFIDDTATGYSGKDVLTKPGAYEDVTGNGFSLPIAELTGRINGYSTRLMGLIPNIEESALPTYPVQDCTEFVKPLLTVPDTAAKMLIAHADEDIRVFLETALEVIHFYETVTSTTKVFLPEEAFAFVDEEVAKSMRSSQHVYVLKNSENQEITQKDCTSTFGVVLPDADDLHSGSEMALSALDILRVIAPCRRELQPGVFQYNGVYHTPYFKVDPKIRGAIPSYLAYLNGYAVNDMLPIQANERHMADNLMTFIRADMSRYVSEIVTGLFFVTQFGQGLRRLLSCKSEELVLSLSADLQQLCPEGVQYTLTYSDIQSAMQDGWDTTALIKLVRGAITLSEDYPVKLVRDSALVTHVAETQNLPFTLPFSDVQKEALTEALIANSIVSAPMLRYILDMCCRAYEVNWGHSGAAKAIPGLVLTSSIEEMNKLMSAYLQHRLGNTPATGIDFSALYAPVTLSTDEDDDSDEDEIFTYFDYYITNDTAFRLRNGTLPQDYFFGSASGAETTESNIVEYWRKVNGTNHISHYISSCFLQTGDLNVLIEGFIKLMRWGDRKPCLLVYQDHPEIRRVFDLNLGKEIPNTAIVDESQLVLSNGCKYSLEGLLTAADILGATPAIVGFLLSRNYGVKKYSLASLVDVGEMILSGNVDIDAFKSVISVNLENLGTITQYENAGYELLVSSRNIELGLEHNIPPASLSEIALLLHPGILRSAEYLKSKQTTMVVTTKDRQYQILTAYCNTIRYIYSIFGEELSGKEITTVDLSAIVSSAYKKYLDQVTEQAPDANAVRAASAVASMNLESAGLYYDERELEGKFMIISDVEMQSNLPSIEFTDPQVKKVAERLSNRIVLLLLETPDCYLLCRKNISPSEILVANKKIEHKRYTAVARLVEALRSGKKTVLSNPSTGEKKPAKLHCSLAEFM